MTGLALTGMDAVTGAARAGLDHLRQSVLDILTTPVGSRIMRRSYGSKLLSLVDRPMDAGLMMDVYAATAEALARWEPRLVVERVQASAASAGWLEITLTARVVADGSTTVLGVAL